MKICALLVIMYKIIIWQEWNIIACMCMCQCVDSCKGAKTFDGMIGLRLRSWLLISQQRSYRSRVAAIGGRTTATGICGRPAANGVERRRSLIYLDLKSIRWYEWRRQNYYDLIFQSLQWWYMVTFCEVRYSCSSSSLPEFLSPRNLGRSVVNVSHLQLFFFFSSLSCVKDCFSLLHFSPATSKPLARVRFAW